MKVRLSDVAYEVSERWNGSKAGVPIVGLEHLEPDELCVRKWDVDPDETTFSKAFKKGQILFGRRRAYQKKLSIATCDGICSGDITVIAAKEDKILPELLPFYLRAERFFDYAIQGSNGSLSPRVKWAHLASYEFELPSISRQREMGEVLWGANRLKEAYKGMVEATDEMLKAKFREMFEEGSHPRVKLGDVCEEVHERISSSKISISDYVTTENMVKDRGGIIIAASIPSDVGLVHYEIGDVLVANIRPYLKKIWLADKGGGCSNDVVAFRSKYDKLSPKYLYAALSQDAFFNYVMCKSRGTKMPRGDRAWMKLYEIPLPPLSVQREFVKIAEGAEVTKVNLKKSIRDVDGIIRGLING